MDRFPVVAAVRTGGALPPVWSVSFYAIRVPGIASDAAKREVLAVGERAA
jgi:hypothetical protein